MRWLVGAAAISALTACGPDPQNGERIYTRTCAACHGPTGMQGTLTDEVAAANLTERIPAMTDEEISDNIRFGGGAMPAQNSIDEAEAADVVAYLRQRFP